MELFTSKLEVKSSSRFIPKPYGKHPVALTPPLIIGDEVLVGVFNELEGLACIRLPVTEFNDIKSFLYDPQWFYLVTHGIKRIWAEHEIGSVSGTHTDLIADTELLAYLLDSGRNDEEDYSLSELASRYRKCRYQNQARELDEEVVCEVLCDDAILIYDIGAMLLERMDDDLRWLYFLGELKVALILNEMSRVGIPVDGAAASTLYHRVVDEVKILEVGLKGEKDWNLNSPSHVYYLLRERDPKSVAHLRKRQVSKSDIESMSSEVAASILEWRALQTDLDFLRTAAGQTRVHPRWNLITKTSRITAKQPAVQNVSRVRCRGLMRPTSGSVLLKADYKQVQMRILANLSNDPELVSAFRAGSDVHWLTVEMCRIKGGTDKERRDKAKAVNFGILFQMTAMGLARELGTDRSTAQRYINAFWAKYSVAKEYLDRFVQELADKKPEERMVRSYSGRIRRFDGAFGVSERRKAKATLLQQSEADILRLAVMRLYARLRDLKLKSRIVMLIHDAIYVEAPQDEAERAREVLKREMERAVELPIVPLEVDLE